jgi:non-ribosomal peptide synthetase component F/acyl carrier protein
VHEHWRVFDENLHDRLSQVASPSFDAMTSEIWPGLLRGAAVCIAPDDVVQDPSALKNWLIENAITKTFQPAPMTERLLLEDWTGSTAALRLLRSAGDRLTRYPSNSIPFRVYNLYGPTEDTVWTTVAPVEAPGESENTPAPHIGRPIANHRVYILGPHMEVQPIGVPGELCIEGEGLAAGYLNRPQLTAEKFVDGKYRTGDRVRWLPDGNIQFIGRIDRQVKIRGFRIELAEIENRLLTHEAVKEAAVTAREDGAGDRRLCAYVVYYDFAAPGLDELKDHLSLTLPHYMIPPFITGLSEMPLNSSGKVNWKALPEPGMMAQANYTAPRDGTESRLLSLWREVLFGEGGGRRAEAVGIDTDFFQAGGHSLKATNLAGRIHKTFDVKVPLTQLLSTPTVRELAGHINRASRQKYIAIEPAKTREYYPLSSSQAQFFILHQMKTQSLHYNMPHAFRLSGPLDKGRLEDAFRALIHRHESLRTSFLTVSGKPFQVIHDNVDFEMGNIGPIAPIGPILPFDLSRAPLMRVELKNISEDVHILLVDLHHIITDGTSIGIMVNEFMALYDGGSLPPLRIHYKDYAQWQQDWMNTPERAKQQDFWTAQLSGPLPGLALPLDRPRGSEPSYEGGQVAFELDENQAAALNELAAERGTTLYNVLLAVFNVMLHKLSGQRDIIVGAPAANRRRPDLEPIIGMFVNTLALRNFPAGEKTFNDFLGEVGRRTLEAHENQEFPFPSLANVILGTTNRHTSRNPIFDVLFLLQNMEIRDLTIKGLTLDTHDLDFVQSPFDLILLGDQEAGKIKLRYIYSTALFDEETIQRFARYFTGIVSAVTDDASPALRDIHLLHDLEEPKAVILEEADGDFGF